MNREAVRGEGVGVGTTSTSMHTLNASRTSVQ
jgi:hypothetical protein